MWVDAARRERRLLPPRTFMYHQGIKVSQGQTLPPPLHLIYLSITPCLPFFFFFGGACLCLPFVVRACLVGTVRNNCVELARILAGPWTGIFFLNFQIFSTWSFGLGNFSRWFDSGKSKLSFILSSSAPRLIFFGRTVFKKDGAELHGRSSYPRRLKRFCLHHF